jgi:hypothetical protein
MLKNSDSCLSSNERVYQNIKSIYQMICEKGNVKDKWHVLFSSINHILKRKIAYFFSVILLMFE